jgi:hypothetical protein
MIKTVMSLYFNIGLLVLPAMMVNAIETGKTYYLYEQTQTPFTKCLIPDGLESHAALTLSSVAKGCKVFHFRADGTIHATTSTTDPKPSEWCLDAATGLGNDGSNPVQLFQCNGKATQTWYLTQGKLRAPMASASS